MDSFRDLTDAYLDSSSRTRGCTRWLREVRVSSESSVRLTYSSRNNLENGNRGLERPARSSFPGSSGVPAVLPSRSSVEAAGQREGP